jgi:hypothetical protein
MRSSTCVDSRMLFQLPTVHVVSDDEMAAEE